MGPFAAATAVTPLDGSTYATEIAEGWDIGGNVNGGYLLALVGRALAAAAGRPDPVTITAHYLAPGRPGPARVETELIRRGTRFATAAGALVAGDRRLLQVVGTFADLTGATGPELIDGQPPNLPLIDDCIPSEPGDGSPPFTGRIDVRLHPDDAGFRTGQPSGTPHMRGWFRLRDGEPIDTIGVLLAVDAFPPTIFNSHLPVAWMPTIELTAHLRARPEPGWLRCAFTTRFVTGGFLEVDGELWDDSGRLVAQSRQLALVPRG